MLHLPDDILLAAMTEKLCKDQLQLFLFLCDYLGIPMAPEKTCGPSTKLSFAGIELDTLLSEARLPPKKIEKCISIISEFLGRKKVTLREIQSLNGLLHFACSVVRYGGLYVQYTKENISAQTRVEIHKQNIQYTIRSIGSRKYVSVHDKFG